MGWLEGAWPLNPATGMGPAKGIVRVYTVLHLNPATGGQIKGWSP